MAAGPAQTTASLHLPPRHQPPLTDTGTPYAGYAGYAEYTEDAEYAEYAECAEYAKYTPCRPRLHTSRHPPPLLGLRKDNRRRRGGEEEEEEEEEEAPGTVREYILARGHIYIQLREDRCGGGGCVPGTLCTHAQPLKMRTHPPPPPRGHLLGLRGGGELGPRGGEQKQGGGHGGESPPCIVGLKRQVAGRDPPQAVAVLGMLRGGGRSNHFMDAEEEAIEGPEMWKQVFLCGTELEQMNEVYAIRWDFSHLDNQLQEGALSSAQSGPGAGATKKVFLFGSTEPQMFPLDENTTTVVHIPVVMAGSFFCLVVSFFFWRARSFSVWSWQVLSFVFFFVEGSCDMYFVEGSRHMYLFR